MLLTTEISIPSITITMSRKEIETPGLKLMKLRYESDAWKRLLEFMKDENVYLKIQLSDILKNDFDKQLLEKLENFQSSFLNEDDLINVLRNDVAELEKLLVWEALEEKNMMRDIENNMESIRRNIDHAEKQFTRIKSEFINYVSENI